MRNIWITSLIIIGLIGSSYPGFAQENDWEKEFVQLLQKGKRPPVETAAGLAYTPSEETVLAEAIKKAIAMKAPACEAMKIAIDLKYTPYAVIKNIFSCGGEVGLNQLCMCATESGINKQIIAKSAADAVSPLGTPVYRRDEIAQAQCLRDIGLGFTTAATPTERIMPVPPPIPFSVAGF
jgi:hypothetical protein